MDATGRIAVTSGHPSDDELAAVVAAIARHRQVSAVAAARLLGPRTSRWIRAARLEASGHPPIDSPMRLPDR
jgi:hypothetical protein